MNILNNFFPEHFTQVDRRGVVGLSLSSIIILIVFLKVNPSFLNRNSEPVAVIEYKSKSVKHKDAFSMSFYEVSAGALLQNKDEIFAAENSSAKIKFLNSKSQITVPSSSLIRIESGIDGDAIEVKEGVVELSLDKSKSIKVKANGKESIISSSGSDQKIKLYMNNGELSVQGDGGKLKINGKEVSTSFDLLSPRAGEIQEAENGLNIKTTSSAPYKVSVSKDASFEKAEIKASFTGKNYLLNQPMEEGEYYLKVENGKETKVVPIIVKSKFKITDMSPGEGDILKLNPGDSTVLRWSPKPVKKYRVTVKTSDGVVKNYLTEKTELVLGDMKGNSFEWSVVPELSPNKFSSVKAKSSVMMKFDGKVELLETSKKAFKTTDKNLEISWKAPKGEHFLVKLSDPVSGKTILDKKVNSRKLKLPINSIGKLDLTIASLEYPTMKKVEDLIDLRKPIALWPQTFPSSIKSIESEENIKLQVELDKKFQENSKLIHKYNNKEQVLSLANLNELNINGFGKHCLTVVPKTPVEGYSESDEHCIDFIRLPPFPPLPRARDIVMNFERHNGVDTYKITIPEIKNAIKYYFEVYRDEAGKKLVYKIESNEPVHYWASNRSGIYFLKYKVADKKNRLSDYSPASKLIFPISPLSSW